MYLLYYAYMAKIKEFGEACGEICDESGDRVSHSSQLFILIGEIESEGFDGRSKHHKLQALHTLFSNHLMAGCLHTLRVV